MHILYVSLSATTDQPGPGRGLDQAVHVSSTCIHHIDTFTWFVDNNTNPRINLCLLASAPLRQSLVVLHAAEPSSTKKADVIDLTLESSSDDDDDEDDTDHPLKKRCVYISKNEEIHAKG